METKILMDFMRDVPLAFVAVFVILIYVKLSDHTKRLTRIEESHMTIKDCENNRKLSDVTTQDMVADIKSLKDNKVWLNVFDPAIAEIKEKLARIQNALNGAIKNG